MMRRFWSNAGQFLAAYLDDLLYWLGAGLCTAGAYQIHPASAFVVAGGFCLYFSYLIGKARSR